MDGGDLIVWRARWWADFIFIREIPIFGFGVLEVEIEGSRILLKAFWVLG
jgi:hypothetical protein